MEVVNSEDDIRENLETFENYLCSGTAEEQEFAHSLIQRGSCFIAYEINGELRFSPSRYTGYRKNNNQRHFANTGKDGKETNAAINRVIGYTLSPDEALEERYLTFANSFGISPYNKNRKFWRLNLQGSDFSNNTNTEEGFPEGKLVERKHKSRERNPALIAEAKARFLEKNNTLHCEICKFDFEQKYGERGKGYIEAHHTIPVSEMEPGQKTRIEDIVLVCSNCHKMLHRTRPWLGLDELRKLINEKT